MRFQDSAGHGETQRSQRQHAVFQPHMGIQVVDRQLAAMDDVLAGEFHVGVHCPPALGAEFLHRQHLVRRLAGGFAARLFLLVGVGADQRTEVNHAQLIGAQLSG
ncbi:hypothetical protein D3C81_1644040 [compost metagenome]